MSKFNQIMTKEGKAVHIEYEEDDYIIDNFIYCLRMIVIRNKDNNTFEDDLGKIVNEIEKHKKYNEQTKMNELLISNEIFINLLKGFIIYSNLKEKELKDIQKKYYKQRKENEELQLTFNNIENSIDKFLENNDSNITDTINWDLID